MTEQEQKAVADFVKAVHKETGRTIASLTELVAESTVIQGVAKLYVEPAAVPEAPAEDQHDAG